MYTYIYSMRVCDYMCDYVCVCKIMQIYLHKLYVLTINKCIFLKSSWNTVPMGSNDERP